MVMLDERYYIVRSDAFMRKRPVRCSSALAVRLQYSVQTLGLVALHSPIPCHVHTSLTPQLSLRNPERIIHVFQIPIPSHNHQDQANSIPIPIS
jgi:hypothetical protein